MVTSAANNPKLFDLFNEATRFVKDSNVQRVKEKFSRIAKAIFIISGIYLCYVTSGYYQEKIPFLIIKADNNVSIPFFLNSLLCLCNVISSSTVLLIQHIYHKLHFYSMAMNKDKHYSRNFFGPLNKKAVCKLSLTSLSLTGAAISSTLALKHITFPTQVLVKSAKMVPIVLGSYLIFGKKYKFFDYIMVIIITVSLICFNIFKTFTSKSNEQTVLGIGLCFISLIFDSYTGPSQEEILSWCNIDPITMMFVMNAISFLYTLTISLYYGGIEAFNIVMSNPQLRTNVFYYTVSASIGQFFIYLSINEFGSLYTCTITTMRKAVTTLVSIYFFGHKISAVQWICIFAIFATLLAQQYHKAQIKQKTM